VNHDPGQRTYRQLWRDDHLTAWLICWMQDHDTGFHDHDLSAGAVAVVEGCVCEERLVLGGAPLARTFAAGATFEFAPSDIHRVLHAAAVPAVTLHTYSPPLAGMGAYTIRPDGVLARHSVSYAEELRPLEPSL
jgi:Cysteine dioxygenase type I